VLAELSISAKHVQRITERLGEERRQQRETQVAAMKAGTLRPTYPNPPPVAAIHLDAGKLQLREEDGQPGVRDPRWGSSWRWAPGPSTELRDGVPLVVIVGVRASHPILG